MILTCMQFILENHSKNKKARVMLVELCCFLLIDQTVWLSTRSDTNRAVQPKKMPRGLKFRNKEVHVEGLYYLCSENEGA